MRYRNYLTIENFSTNWSMNYFLLSRLWHEAKLPKMVKKFTKPTHIHRLLPLMENKSKFDLGQNVFVNDVFG